MIQRVLCCWQEDLRSKNKQQGRERWGISRRNLINKDRQAVLFEVQHQILPINYSSSLHVADLKYCSLYMTSDNEDR